MTAHPAKFSDPILEVLSQVVEPFWRVLDPFAGTGRVHELDADTVGIELEPEWASMHPRTICGDALRLPFPDGTFDAIVTSPTYGNRMADHHEARDSSRRLTYRHQLGRSLTPGNSGALQWGEAYRDFHVAAWREALRVLRPCGTVLINVSDHIRKGERVRVVDFHRGALIGLGARHVGEHEVETQRMRFGANAGARVESESILYGRKAA